MVLKNLGVSTLEMLTGISLLTILIAVAAPSFAELNNQLRANLKIREIQQTLQLARNAAINYGLPVTACPIEANKCSENWHKGVTVFLDTGTMGVMDNQDKIIAVTGEFDARDFLGYNRSAINFKPDGLAQGSNGTFSYCPQQPDSQYSRAVIVNQAGRVRFSHQPKITCQ